MSTEPEDRGDFEDLQRLLGEASGREFRLAALHLMEDVADARRKSVEAVEERRRAEDRVKVIEERYRALFTQMDQGLGVAEVEYEGDTAVGFRWLDVNEQFADATGLPRAVVGRGMREAAPGLEPEWLQVLSEVARTGKAVRFEQRSECLGRWLEVNAFRLREPDRRQVVVLVRDTTRRAQQAGDLAFLAAVADDCSRLSSVDSMMRIVGKRTAEHLAVAGCELVEAANDEHGRVQVSGQRVVVTLGRIGEKRAALAVVAARPRDWSDHDVGLIESLARQVHPALQRAEAEDALRSSRERLRLIVENARDYAILTMDLDRRITSWNPGAERLTGFAADEVMGQPGDILFTPEGRSAGAPEREAQTAIAEGRASDERWHVRKDGSRFWGSGSMLAMRNGAGQAVGLLKIFRDQTAELRAKEVLERSRRELWEALQETERARKDAEAAARAKDQLFAVLSHELRTPLTPVMFGTEMLLMREDIDASMREALGMIQRNVALEARLVDDLLDVTRIRHGKVELMFAAMNVHDAVREAVEVATPDIEARGQRLTVALEARKVEVMGDATRLKQVVWNVLKNASKFTAEGGEIRVSTRNEPARIVIEVADTGIGIEPSMLTRIFDTFTQVDASITRAFGGLGLGLAIAKGIVERHGGQIEAHSGGLGQGATFTVSLPLGSHVA